MSSWENKDRVRLALYFRQRKILSYDFTKHSDNYQNIEQTDYKFNCELIVDPQLRTETDLQIIKEELKQMYEWREE
jgi:hypothetical protein